MSYFHVRDPGLPVGHEIAPGTWWKTVLSIPQHKWFTTEHFVESVRMQFAPNRPSRMRSAFVFDEISHARRYRDEHEEYRGFSIYEVEIVEPDANVYRTHQNCLHPDIISSQGLDELLRLAYTYWDWPTELETDGHLMEVLVESPIRILNTVE